MVLGLITLKCGQYALDLVSGKSVSLISTDGKSSTSSESRAILEKKLAIEFFLVMTLI